MSKRPIKKQHSMKKALPMAMTALILSLVLSIAFIPVNLHAAGRDKPVRVGYYEKEVFEEGAIPGSIKTGYAYEYYSKIAEYTGWNYSYVYGDYTELYRMLIRGEIDLMAGFARNEVMENLMSYPDDPMGHESYSLVKHDSDTDITMSAASLRGKKIGVFNGYVTYILNDYLTSHHVKADVQVFNTYAKLYKAFDDKEIDVFAGTGDSTHGRAHAEVLNTFGSSDYYLCVSSKRKDILSELNLAQAQLNAEEPNYISALRSRYYPSNIAEMAFSESERKWLTEHAALNVGYLNNYMPYCDTDENGNVTGMVKDILPEIFKDIGDEGIRISYRGYNSYDEMIDDMRYGVIDAAFPVGGGLYYSEESGIHQSTPVISSTTELIHTGDFSGDTVKSFAINENNGMQYYYVRTYYPDAEIKLYPSIDDCLKAVLNGETGCTTLNGLRANDILRNAEYSDLSMAQSAYDDDRCLGVSIGNEGLLRLINRGINVIGDDYAQNLAYRYSNELYTYTIREFIRDNQVAITLIVLSIFTILIIFFVRDLKRTKREIAVKDKANRAKTVFLNNMSHDIRTPMNAIVGFTGLASSNLDDKEKLKDYLSKIAVSSAHLLALINDILDMSRIESGKVKIEETEVYLPDLIEDVENIIRNNVDEKKQTLTVNTAGIKNKNVITDKLRLNQVLINILSNAVKYTPEGGDIEFTATENKSEKEGYAALEFRVKDNGIGMSAEFKDTIFEAFTREQTSTVSGIQGTGLGMAITKNIIDMMKGSITVESTEGEGSEFTVNVDCLIDKNADNSKASKEKKSVYEGKEMPDFSGHKLLLAEDNELNQQIALAILKRVGFEVDVANDGGEAVEKVRDAAAGEYEVVLMDIQMPKMNGYDAARNIRALSDTEKANIPIIAVTANAFEEDRQNALEVGMNGHLAKPYDVPKIMETLSEIINP